MKKIKSLFAIALLTLTACNSTQEFKCSERVSLYNMEEAGSKYYRIPALVKAKDGSLVAIADKRGDALGDLPNIITIVSKRSTDGGKWVLPLFSDAKDNKNIFFAWQVIFNICHL